MKITQTQATLALALLTIGVVYYTVRQAKGAITDGVGQVIDGAGDAVQAINPFNNQNLFYTATNNVGAAITGDQNFNLGGFLYDKKQEADAERAALGVSEWMLYVPPVAIGTALYNKAKQAFTGDSDTRGVTGTW